MRTIKFDVEDSKVSEILQALLNSGVTVKNVEVTSTQHSKTVMVSESCTAEDSGSSLVLYRHSYQIGKNEGTSTTAVILGVKPVGGTIFYIDDSADGIYEFFDVDGNLMENVQVGDRPYAYRVIKKGSKDKYYVYHDKVYNNLRWTYCRGKDYVYESLDMHENIDSGKRNTEKVMEKDSGSYIAADSKGYPTIWRQLQQVRDAKVGGCNDWFVPSRYEIEKLRIAIKSGIIVGGTIAGSSYEESIFIRKWFWSSSEYSSQGAWGWSYTNQYWYGGGKAITNSVFFVRAF